MPRKKVTHKYRRVQLASHKVFACSLPDCTHFMPVNMNNFLIGRVSICWQCEQEFLFSNRNLEEDFPICSKCKNPELTPSLMEILSGD